MTLTLQPNWILEKTSKGRDEVGSRARALPPSIRGLLILADGRRTARELLSASPDPVRSQAGLSVLLAEGYIQPVDGSGRPVGEEGTTAGCKEKLIALAREMFGSNPKLLQKLDAAEDSQESICGSIEACGKFIRLFLDAEQAEVFLQRANALLKAQQTSAND